MKKLFLLVLLFAATPAWATTYYVANGGNDSSATPTNPATPWANPQRCTTSPIIAGDTCLVADGTYTDTNSDGHTITTSGGVSGTASMPITIKSTNRLGAKITVSSAKNCTAPTTCQNSGFNLVANYYVIDGFDISGGTSTGTGVSYAGVQLPFGSGGTGNVIKGNRIHNIANICSNSAYGFGGIFVYGNSVSIIGNTIDNIGRLYNGQSGCSTSMTAHDHGIYFDNGSNGTVRDNLLHHIVHGYALHIYPGSISGLNIQNNTVADSAADNAVGANVLLGGSTGGGLSNINITNNIFHGAVSTGSIAFFGLTASNIVIDHNLCSVACTGSSNSGVTFSNSINSTNPGFANPSTFDYTLVTSSPAINVGANIGLLFNGVAPDIGTFETPRFSTCSVESGDANTLRLTFQNSLNPPLLPSSGITGFTSKKNGLNNPISGSQRTGTNRIDFTLGSAINGGDLIDVSVASTNLTDSSFIGGSLNQPYVQGLTSQSCVNNVVGGTTFVLTQSVYRFNGLRGTEAAPVATPYATAPENTNVYVVPGGSVRLRIGVKDTIAAAPPTGFIPRYRMNGGTLTVVPDTFSSDKIAFCGSSPDPDVPASGTVTTQQLNGSGSFVAGGFIRTSNAVPTITLALNNRTEMEYCFTFAPNASPNATYDFYLTQQDGTNLIYSVIPRATITGSQVGMGF